LRNTNARSVNHERRCEIGILNKVLHRSEEKEDEKTPLGAADLEPVCPHTALTQHWDKLEDMGKQELATYRCESCYAEFSADEAKLLMDQPPSALVAEGTREEGEKI
jgi:hypothetical protein